MDEDSYPQVDRRKGVDRRQRRRYRFHDRRSGFDRRVNGVKMGVLKRTLIALRDRPTALRRLLIAVNLLNMADFWLTLIALESGGREANPLLRPLFALSPLWAGVFKVVAVLAATLLVWEARRYRKALIVGLCMLAVFTGLLLYHIFALVFIPRRPFHSRELAPELVQNTRGLGLTSLACLPREKPRL